MIEVPLLGIIRRLASDSHWPSKASAWHLTVSASPANVLLQVGPPAGCGRPMSRVSATARCSGQSRAHPALVGALMLFLAGSAVVRADAQVPQSAAETARQPPPIVASFEPAPAATVGTASDGAQGLPPMPPTLGAPTLGVLGESTSEAVSSTSASSGVIGPTGGSTSA